MLTKPGAKLLDFGLAKPIAEGQPSLTGLSAIPTREKPITEQGVVVGTFQYMAPEQLEARRLMRVRICSRSELSFPFIHPGASFLIFRIQRLSIPA